MPSGQELKLAAKKGTTWGTAVVCGANDGILMLPGTLKKSQDSKIDDSLGLFWPTDVDAGEIKAEGERKFYMRYDTLDLFISLFMGLAGAPIYTTPADTGTATSGTSTTLTCTGKTWGTTQYIGRFVKITGGTGIGQVRKIISHTATVLTVAAFTVTPDATSTFEIDGLIAAHTYDLADAIDGLFATLAINKVVNIVEAPSAKLMGMTLKGSVGNPVEVDFDILANNVILDSAVNTTGTFANVTYREIANRVLFNQAIFRMNAQAGAALGTGDKIWPSDFELSVKRKMSGMYGAGGTFDTIDEPTNDGVPEVKLKLTFPRYTSSAMFTDWAAGNAKKMDITFTGKLISGSTYRSMTLLLPNLKYANVESPEERGIIKNPAEFICLAAAAAPSGMTGVTKPFRLQLTNSFGGDPLQAGN